MNEGIQAHETPAAAAHPMEEDLVVCIVCFFLTETIKGVNIKQAVHSHTLQKKR